MFYLIELTVTKNSNEQIKQNYYEMKTIIIFKL
jgi:hypothetical protein